MRSDLRLLPGLVVAALAFLSTDASAFCRSTTVATPAGPSGCVEEGHPLFWPSSCVGYHMNQAASEQVSLADASAIMAGVFAGWASGNGICFPSISVTALAPTASTVGYDMNGPNENVVAFLDQQPDPPGATEVLEKATVTFDHATGAILDADIQIMTYGNSFLIDDSVDAGDSYDLRYVMTHAAGHFLGLAHSMVPEAVMTSIAAPGAVPRPWIKDDDARGLCAIYPQNGTRTTTDTSGAPIAVPATACNLVAETTCNGAISVGHGCSLAPSRKTSPLGLAALLAAACAFLRRRRGWQWVR
jgi:hypothetical protein